MKFIPVGRVVAAHGVRGEIKFRYYNEDVTASSQYPSFFVDDNGAKRELKSLHARPQGSLFLIKFAAWRRRRGALSPAQGASRKGRGPCAVRCEDEYYDYQLIGLAAVTEQDRTLGTVVDVMHTKANDILVVGGSREVLVPMTEAHIVSVSMEDGLVQVREDGLVE